MGKDSWRFRSQLMAQRLHTNGIPKHTCKRPAVCAKLPPHETATADLAAQSADLLRLDSGVRKQCNAREIGLENVEAQIRLLAQTLIAGARELGIRIQSPLSSVGPLVVFECRDVEAVITRLAERSIVVSGRHDGLRVSFHVHNTLDDVQEVLRALKGCLDLMVRERQPARACGI
jgi:hypothetical protein